MWKNESHNSRLSTEDDLKKVASYAERRDFVRGATSDWKPNGQEVFDKNYTGKTGENLALLRNERFKKAYLEKFSGIRNSSRESRMNMIKGRPDQHPEVQKVRESFFSKIGQALREMFQGLERPARSMEDRLVAWRDSLKAYSGKLVRQFNSVKLTGYYPPPKWGYKSKKEAKMEWGAKDKLWKPLYTLEQYLQWKAPYVSIAGHESIAYWTRIRLPHLEAQYGRPIDCRVVDTGSAFNRQSPFSKLDVCVRDRQASMTSLVNTRTSVQQIA